MNGAHDAEGDDWQPTQHEHITDYSCEQVLFATVALTPRAIKFLVAIASDPTFIALVLGRWRKSLRGTIYGWRKSKYGTTSSCMTLPC